MSLARRLEKLEQDLPFVVSRPEGLNLTELICYLGHKVADFIDRPEAELDKVVKACCDLITDEESDEFMSILRDLITQNADDGQATPGAST